MADFYQILGVSRDADADTLKRAYRKLARQYHPDINKEPGAEDKFKEIGKAYEALADPKGEDLSKEMIYDMTLMLILKMLFLVNNEKLKFLILKRVNHVEVLEQSLELAQLLARPVVEVDK